MPSILLQFVFDALSSFFRFSGSTIANLVLGGRHYRSFQENSFFVAKTGLLYH